MRSTKKAHTGTGIICGKEYALEVKNGVCFVDGEESDAFIDRMIKEGRFDIVGDFAKLGQKMMRGDVTFGSPQEELHSLHAGRTQCN